MRVSIDKTFELQNLVRRSGRLFTRKGLVSVKTPTSGTQFVAGRTIEVPTSGEVLHYLVERNTTTGGGALRVFTEEFYEVFSVGLGLISPDVPLSDAVSYGQMMLSSPAFSSPLYGIVGGGLIPAEKVDSINEATTSLDIPPGHVCQFGDRVAIGYANQILISDPVVDASRDLRSFVAESVIALPGTIYDLCQGPDGALYIFTSRDVFIIPVDAIGQGQTPNGFVATAGAINTSRPRNAVAYDSGVAVLQRDHILILRGNQEVRVPLFSYFGRRYHGKAIEQDDLRLNGELYATPNGLVVGFRGARGYFLEINTKDGYQSWVWNDTAPLNLCGTLRTREGEVMYVLSDRIVMPIGREDWTGGFLGVASGRLDVPESESVTIRRVSVSSDNVGFSSRSWIGGDGSTDTTPVETEDTAIGTDAWSDSLTFSGRQTRTVRHEHSVRTTDVHVEIAIAGGDFMLEPSFDVEIAGQGKNRRDKVA